MPENEQLKPSDFSNAGKPHCSIWGKTETESLAWIYVTAMARDGDDWHEVSAQQCRELLNEDELRFSGWEVQKAESGDPSPRWPAVVARITDAEGALSVGGFWDRWSIEKRKAEVKP